MSDDEEVQFESALALSVQQYRDAYRDSLMPMEVWIPQWMYDKAPERWEASAKRMGVTIRTSWDTG